MCGVICESIKERMEKLSGGLPPTESIRTKLGVVGIRNYSRHDSLTWQREREERGETRSGSW